MRKLVLLALFCLATTLASAQTTTNKTDGASKQINAKVVEIACGQCQFKMPADHTNAKSKGCDLAIRVDGVSYFVDGRNIDDFGDAHGKHGFCNAISKAEVTGEIIANRFKAKSIKLVPKN